MKKNNAMSDFILLFTLLIFYSCKPMISADMILINGRVITVDRNFTIAEAVAFSKDKILEVGSTSHIKKLAGKETKVIDLNGRCVIPGLIDAHLHPESASLSEIEERLPDINSISQLLAWIKSETLIKEKGKWIIFPKYFFTRMLEMRQPTLHELDSVAPSHPVFLNGSFGGMINSAAMSVSGITSETKNNGIVKDEKTGLATGFITGSAFNILKIPRQKQYTFQEKQDALRAMLKRYNSYGITSLFSGAGDFESVKMYRDMADKKILTARICQNILLQTEGKISRESVTEKLKKWAGVTGSGDEWVRIGSLKVFLDGGILTGTAYLDEPWGEKAGTIFGIKDPGYRGIINFTREDLLSIVSVANEFNWSFTAHATGGGSVDLLLDVYNEVNGSKSIKQRRFSIIHGNFFTDKSIRLMKELGVYANIQPVWYYKDADAMEYILGKERIKTFLPVKKLVDAGVIINGGSDHMVKWDAYTSINPYNPFLAIWTMVTRETERGTIINPEEAVSREQALKIYTINNAYASFEEKIKGSIEPGKLADISILSDDILTCPDENIKEIKSLMTIVGGKIVYTSNTTF